MRINNWLIAALLPVSPSLYAHTGGHLEHSLLSGLAHPLTGIDHLLVLLAVGLVAAKQAGKAMFAFPAVFFGLMASGALLNAYGVQIPFIEALIALSVILFGFLVGIKHEYRSNLLFLGASLFAIFHGYAHAAEIPAGANIAEYFSALMLMSLAICLTGIAIGRITGQRIGYLLSLLCLGSGLYFLAAG